MIFRLIWQPIAFSKPLAAASRCCHSGTETRTRAEDALADPSIGSNHGPDWFCQVGQHQAFVSRQSLQFSTLISDKNSRNLLGFLVLNLSFAFVELAYGVWTNSLGLISDSFHMFFDCTGTLPIVARLSSILEHFILGLLAGLVASVITKWKADEKFSYGYVRAEVRIIFVPNLTCQ